MSSSDGPSPQAPGPGGIQEFLKRFFRDQDEGRVLPLEDYRALYPHLGESLEGSYRLLVSNRSDESGGATDHVAFEAERIGPHTILRRLGGGGQGSVFLCRRGGDGEDVAVKVLTGVAGTWTESTLQRFKREALVASRLQHPGICPVLETGEEDGIPYLVMPYIQGETLAWRIAAARGDVAAAEGKTIYWSASIATQELEVAAPADGGVLAQPSASLEIEAMMAALENVARALHAAHEAGIVHRDIKPGNVIIGPSGRPVILDFGLAHDTSPTRPNLTSTGQFLGTVPYMAPEQIESANATPDRLWDIYALGVTAYECVTLQRPYPQKEWKDLCRAIVEGRARDPRELNPAVTDEVAAVISKAMARSPADRHETAELLADGFAAARRHADGTRNPLRRITDMLKRRR